MTNVMSGTAETLVQKMADIATAVLAIPGVAGLDCGRSDAGTTPSNSRCVNGIRLSDSDGEVHLVARLSDSLLDTVERARRAAAEIAGYHVDVVIERVVTDDDPIAHRAPAC